MTFEKPDTSNFEGLALAYEAARVGGSMPTIYNAANERAVSLFLDRKISYLGIVDLIKEAMMQHKVIDKPDLEQILQTEQEAYQFINRKIGK